MARVHIEETLLREPNLWVPGKKPIGPVKIDWEHPLGKLVQIAFIPGGGIARDAMRPPLNVEYTTTTPIINSRYADLRDDGGFVYDDSFDVVTEFTILVRASRESTNLDGLVSDKNNTNWNTSDGFSLSGRGGMGRFFFRIGANNSVYDNTVGSLNTFHNIAATWKASVEQKVYQDGVALTQTSASGTVPATSFTKSSQSIRIGTYYAGGPSWSWDGLIDYAFVVNKHMTQQEIIAFHLDPYQFLIPA